MARGLWGSTIGCARGESREETTDASGPVGRLVGRSDEKTLKRDPASACAQTHTSDAVMAACFLSSEPPPSGLGRTGCRLILTSDTMPLAIPAVLVVVAASASGCAERRAPAYLHKHVYTIAKRHRLCLIRRKPDCQTCFEMPNGLRYNS